MAHRIFCMAATAIVLLALTFTLRAEDVSLSIVKCPRNVRAGQNLASTFQLAIENNRDTALRDAALELVLKDTGECPGSARHAFYSPNYFSGVLLREGRESVSLAPREKKTIRLHGLNTIPQDTPVGRQYFLCVNIFVDSKVPGLGKEMNCSCCPVRIVGTEEGPVITGYAETCLGRNGTVTIRGRNFGSAAGKAVSLGGAAIPLNLPVISWSDSTIAARVPDSPAIQDGRQYFIGIRKVSINEWLSNTGVFLPVCPGRKTSPGQQTAPKYIPPFFY